MAAFELAPMQFCWRTRQDLPDLKKCSKALRDAEARTPALLAKSSDRYKRQLTPEGFRWIEENQARLEAGLERGASQRPVRNTQKTSDVRAKEREKERLLGTTALGNSPRVACQELQRRRRKPSSASMTTSPEVQGQPRYNALSICLMMMPISRRPFELSQKGFQGTNEWRASK